MTMKIVSAFSQPPPVNSKIVSRNFKRRNFILIYHALDTNREIRLAGQCN